PTDSIPISTLSLHDALPIFAMPSAVNDPALLQNQDEVCLGDRQEVMSDHKAGSPSHESVQGFSDLRFALGIEASHRLVQDQDGRSESTRLNSSHVAISYAVF